MKKNIFIGLLGIVIISQQALSMQQLGIQGLQTAFSRGSAMLASPLIVQAVRNFSATSKLCKPWNYNNQKPENILGINCNPSLKEVHNGFIKTIKNCDPKDSHKLFMAQESLAYFEEQCKQQNQYYEIDYNQSQAEQSLTKQRIEAILKHGTLYDIASMGRTHLGWIRDTFYLKKVIKEHKELLSLLNIDTNYFVILQKKLLEQSSEFNPIIELSNLLNIDKNNSVILKKKLLEQHSEFNQIIDKYYHQMSYIKNYKKAKIKSVLNYFFWLFIMPLWIIESQGPVKN